MEDISGSSSSCELLIVHTAEAQEWAEYLNAILKSSRTLHKHSILSYEVSCEDQLHGYNFEYFHRSKCVILLVTVALLELLGDEELHKALQRLLHPPRQVVALLCGVSEEDVPAESFQHWPSWSKLHTEDEATVYIATILEAMSDRKQDEADSKREAPETPVSSVKASDQITDDPDAEEYLSAEEGEADLLVDSPQPEEPSLAQCSACLTIQPNRILCGERTTIYIILLHKVDMQSNAEVKFSSETAALQLVAATIQNEYTISVIAPDMPAGLVSLTLLLSDHSSISLTAVTYYTCMDEVSRSLENAMSPIEFICQAFDITVNKTESLDNMLTDLLKSRMPVGGLQLFGIDHIEINNMSTYQRNEELPTLLHFAARYGLKKLTTALLHCPGALQAYSVMNKRGDYPNTLAERSGFIDLRQFIDEFVTADMLQSHIQEEDDGGVYEKMVAGTDVLNKYSGHTEDIYESMLDINPECIDDLYEVMTGGAENQNPEEVMLRKFFQVQPGAGQSQDEQEHRESEGAEDVSQNDVEQHKEEEKEEKEEKEEEEDDGDFEDGPCLSPKATSEDIYDVVDDTLTYPFREHNRPPAPMPRPENAPDTNSYITRVFSDKITPPMTPARRSSAAEPVTHTPCSSAWNAYTAVKTPGQRQLIALQERVKMGIIDVNEAVQEFKAWQFDHERRSNSLRYQQENLKRLRNSITRRHKERQKMDKNVDLEITAPIQSRDAEASNILECSVYNCTPRIVAPPPAVSTPIQRGTWKTGSTSSTSSTESNRQSVHSVVSSSSGTEPDFEDTMDILPPPPPPPPPRLVRAPSRSPPPPPNLPPPVPERNEGPALQERYIACPTRAVPRMPTGRASSPPPPVPRRLR